MDSRDKEKIVRVEAIEELLSIALDDQSPKKQVKVSSRLSPVEANELTKTLRQNTDVFAWSTIDMPKISSEIIAHRLNISSNCRPMKQKRRQLAPERSQAMHDEVTKLIKADLIREVHYPEWLTNVVLIKKPNGKWRMCVDYIDLNKACPKDSYPLSSIDQLMDTTSGFQSMSFMDAFLGYNQIQMA